MTHTLESIADALWQAEADRSPCRPVRDTLISAAGQRDPIEAAYAVQTLNTQRRQASGGRIVGRKIGLTSRAVQNQLGVDAPDFGSLFADMAFGHGEEIPAQRLMQPKAEAEIALVLERDLIHARHTLADLISATAYVLPALEIVGSRIENWDIRLIDTIADNASSGLFVLGPNPVRLGDFNLIGCGMVMERRGEQVSSGIGAACLGNPLNAAVWLADTMVRMGTPLKAGDIVLTGALGPMVSVVAGDVITAQIEGLGRVDAFFAPE